ncbi:MAG: hypothetical protein A2351_07240 [Omnitrophica bacterium RIFOXYB12_FULL_50_7]|nr:MAG: hypothetical protein A2351_07240 [Omnitrophica bacterium RIFOXYB12_FULL_50_7]
MGVCQHRGDGRDAIRGERLTGSEKAFPLTVSRSPFPAPLGALFPVSLFSLFEYNTVHYELTRH